MFKGTVSTPNFTPPYPACTQLVRPVATACSTPPVRPVTLTGQTGPRKTEGLHTQSSRVQPDNSLVQGSRSITSHPSASRRMNLTQQWQKSTSGWPEMIVATNPEYTNTREGLPDYWVYLAHISRHAKLLAGGLFCRKTSKSGSLFSRFLLQVLYRLTMI